MNDQLLRDLKRDEGFSPKPYKDSEGNLTIGYGTLIEKISRSEAEWFLKYRLSKAISELRQVQPDVDVLPDNVKLAIWNMAYNLGLPKLLGFRRMWAALEARDYETAAAECLDSKWRSQVGARAERIAALIRSAA